MNKKVAIAAGVSAVLLVAGGISGGLVATSDSASSAPPESTQCYFTATGAVDTCPPAPSWLVNHPEALDQDNQPQPFTAFGHSWAPQPVQRYVAGLDFTGCGGQPSSTGTNAAYTVGCEPVALTWQDTASPNVVLSPDGTIGVTNSQQPDNAADRLLVSQAALQSSTLYLKWKAANPKESAAVDAYWTTPSLPPPIVATAFGKAYIAEAEAYHYAHGDYGQ